MVFEAHGFYSFDVRGRILVVEAWGPWNLEAARSFDRPVRKLVSGNLAPDPWATLGRLHTEALYTPNALPLLKELHQWRVAQGMRRVAIVHGEGSRHSAPLTRGQFNQIYAEATGENCLERYFDDQASALDWLREEGFE